MKIRFTTALLLAGLSASPAYAIFNLNSADITKGKFNIESRNRWDEDDRASKNSFQAHSIKMDYGLTKYATIEMQNLWQDVGTKRNEYVSTEFETKLRFYDPGEYWLDIALKFGYEFRHDNDRANQVKTKLLVQRNEKDWYHLANINFSKEVGEYTSKELEMSWGWRTKYKLNPHFEPGIEYYASYGELVDMRSTNNQAHRIGPMFYGEIFPGVKYQAGYLFGLTDAAEDGSFKAFLRYEFML